MVQVKNRDTNSAPQGLLNEAFFDVSEEKRLQNGSELKSNAESTFHPYYIACRPLALAGQPAQA